ncbi:FtsX-like permease family protein [Clostridium sp.]|uniref:FtsX-like permease family protein n=1 Tax=Clostridium sp. TaxID=1506 RepID=UPI003216479E
MNKLFYQKLALTNIKNNSKTYYPYIITCICTISMFYIMHSFSINKGLDEIVGSENIKTILNLGTVIIGVFSAIFLFYTNSFLIKRRKKELGLYNVLGLEKKHIAKVLFFESIIISGSSLFIGIIGGIILNKLMFLLFLKILNFHVTFGFSISILSIVITLIVFLGIFILTLMTNLFQIKISKPIELLKGGEHGEKEPKTKWVIALIGLVALATGYGMSLSVKDPISALNLFFVAVILVMIGTYALFTAGSIAMLKLLRKNKRFYYKTRNFISISSMMYRMKQNAVGLANICILSTAVVVILSTTVSLYVGMEDILRYRFSSDVTISTTEINTDKIKTINEIVESEIKESKVNISNRINYTSNSFAAMKEDTIFKLNNDNTYNSNASILSIVSISDYNRLEGKDIILEDNEVIIFSTTNNYGKDVISIGDKTFKIKEEVDSLTFAKKNRASILDTYIVILNNIDSFGEFNKSYDVAFDVDGNDSEMLKIINGANQSFIESGINVSIESVADSRESFFALYGSLLFLGLFLGSLFLMATVLIIYYKQISEGYEDKERFEIMQKIGMSKVEIKKTISSQILIIFFLPIIFTAIHIVFAFPIITKLLALLNLTNMPLFRLCTIATVSIFAVIYGIVFILTAKIYYKIVK